jgi:hypothetical protein
MFMTPNGRFETNTKICISFRYEMNFLPYIFIFAGFPHSILATITQNFGILLGELNQF